MNITKEQIVRLAPHVDPARAEELAKEVNRGLADYGAGGFLSRAHFMAQACHETDGFAHFEENLRYSNATRIAAVWPRLAGRAADLAGHPEALANAAYGGRMGNHDEASGDGWRFRGRGIFQLTGRANYQAAGAALKADLLGHPELLLQMHYAVESALWFWRQHGCVEKAARDDVEDVTRAINGSAMAGLTERRWLTEGAKRIFV